MQILATLLPPLIGMGKRIGRAKVRKHVGEDKGSLIKKEGGRETSDARAVTHDLPQAGRPMRSWSWCNGCLGRQSHLFLFSLLLGLMLSYRTSLCPA